MARKKSSRKKSGSIFNRFPKVKSHLAETRRLVRALARIPTKGGFVEDGEHQTDLAAVEAVLDSLETVLEERLTAAVAAAGKYTRLTALGAKALREKEGYPSPLLSSGGRPVIQPSVGPPAVEVELQRAGDNIVLIPLPHTRYTIESGGLEEVYQWWSEKSDALGREFQLAEDACGASVTVCVGRRAPNFARAISLALHDLVKFPGLLAERLSRGGRLSLSRFVAFEVTKVTSGDTVELERQGDRGAHTDPSPAPPPGGDEQQRVDDPDTGAPVGEELHPALRSVATTSGRLARMLELERERVQRELQLLAGQVYPLEVRKELAERVTAVVQALGFAFRCHKDGCEEPATRLRLNSDGGFQLHHSTGKVAHSDHGAGGAAFPKLELVDPPQDRRRRK